MAAVRSTTPSTTADVAPTQCLDNDLPIGRPTELGRSGRFRQIRIAIATSGTARRSPALMP